MTPYCSLEKEKKLVDKENVEFEYIVGCLQEVILRLEKDNSRLSEMHNVMNEKVIEIGQFAEASRENQTKKRNEAKDEKYDLQKESVQKANEERDE